jgi:hypothetical protein
MADKDGAPAYQPADKVVCTTTRAVTRSSGTRIVIEAESEDVKRIGDEIEVLEMAKWLVLHANKEWQWIPEVNTDILLEAVRYCQARGLGDAKATAERLLCACMDRDVKYLADYQERVAQIQQSIDTFRHFIGVLGADGPVQMHARE